MNAQRLSLMDLDVIARQAGEIRYAERRGMTTQIVLQQLEHALHAFRAVRGEPPHHRSAQ